MAQSSGLAGTIGADARALVRRTWWVFLIGGLASVLFGVLAFVNPGIALLVLAMFFVAAILVDGIFNVIGAIQNREKDGWWLMLLMGLLEIGVGGYALLNPPVSMLAFVFLVALEAIVLGVFLLALGLQGPQGDHARVAPLPDGGAFDPLRRDGPAAPRRGQPHHRLPDRFAGPS